MITRDNKSVSYVYVGDSAIGAIYRGNDLVWQPWSTDDIWKDTYISRQFLNTSGKPAVSTNGDRYEVFNSSTIVGDMYKLTWDEVIVGTGNTYPTIRICFFDRFGNFIAPRYSYTALSAGKYIVTVPDNAISMDIRIDDRSSARLQGFNGFHLYKN